MVICAIGKRVLLMSQARMVLQANSYGNVRSTSRLSTSRKVGLFQPCRHVPNSRFLSTMESWSLSATSSSNKMSKTAIVKAQDALCDYLRNTRSLQLEDADHISKNSQHFVTNLLAKVGDEEDVARSLLRYFQWHPINEFEPFFESLGLMPTEYLPLLPKDLMFLSDDHVLLDNFHELCDYGIPRSMMGKMYAGAESIFRYDYGVLALKFKGYEKLGLSKATVIKLVTSDPSLLVGNVSIRLVEFLKRLNALGFQDDWLSQNLSAGSPYNWNRMSRTIDLLFRLGSGNRDVAILFQKDPSLLLDCDSKAIQILVGQFFKLGLKKDEVVTLFSKDQNLMSKKFVQNLSYAVSFLFEIGMEMEDIAQVIQKHSHIIGSGTLQQPKIAKSAFIVDRSDMCKMIKEDPTKIFKPASISLSKDEDKAPIKCSEKIIFLKQLGYIENSKEIMEAAKKFRGRGDKLQERFDCLVQSGIDRDAVVDIIKQAPPILNQTKDVLEKKLHFLTDHLGYPLDSVISFPTYLGYKMERITLRLSMYMWLRERNAANPALSLSTILACSDAQFVKYFVDRHPQGPAAWKTLKESLQAQGSHNYETLEIRN